MMMNGAPGKGPRPPAGFTLIELMVALVILVLIVGIAVPAIETVRTDSQVDRILETVKTLRVAVGKHYAHTSTMASERAGKRFEASRFHELSADQSYRGWKGPYMAAPLSSSDNPFGGAIQLYESLDGGMARPFEGGFRLSGASSPKLSGAGQFVGFTKVPQHMARAVDAALDEGISGNWAKFGRVQWKSAHGGTLMVFLMDV